MSRSSSSCCIDGLVAKGGVAACVFGDADGPATCLRPGLAVADCLVGRLLASARYARVLCVCLDRTEEAVRRVAGLYLEQQASVPTASCSPDVAAAKLTTCKTLDDASTALMHSNGEGATAVVLYSLSELLLERGVAATLAAVNSLRGPGDGDDHGEQRTRPTLIAVVHTTLHPPHVLAQLLPRRSSCHGHGRDVFNAACFVRGNDGTLAAELACEVQVVRVSIATGKVVEDTDYFAARARSLGGAGSGALAQGPPVALLHPIPQLKKQKVPAASVTAASATPASTTTTTTTTTTAAGGSATSNSNSNHAAASIAGNRRLITFDSTDPEFDDDSDPDADLDL